MFKTCCTCKEEKLLSEFTQDKSRVSGRKSSCKICSRAKSRSDWTNKYGEKYNLRKADTRADRKLLIAEAKSCGCLFCDEKEPICLDFHHKDPTEKEYGVGAMLSFSRTRIQEEIEKCVVVCANCHRKVHAGILVV